MEPRDGREVRPGLLRIPEPSDPSTRIAMLREFYVASRYSLLAAVLMIAMHSAYVASHVPLPALAAWLAFAVALLVLRLAWRTYFLALSAEQAAGTWQRWQHRAVGGAAATGVMWASGLAMAFGADDVVSQMYCATLAMLTCVASINVMAPVPRAFQALVWPVAVVLALHFALLDARTGLAFALMTLAAAAMATGLAHRHFRLLLESYALRFEREAALAQLQDALAAKSRFIAAASHDLRQPLHALGLLVAQWREEGRLGAMSGPASDEDLADRIGSSVQDLSALVGALLDLSRLDRGSVPLAVQPLALAPLFDRLAREFALQAEARGVQWRVRPTPLWVHSDALQLERMLRNLLSNALRCTPEGGVLLAARSLRGGVRIGVWDTGVGIAQADQRRVFEEFVRLPLAAHANAAEGPNIEPSGGLGLGLAIVTRLAQALGHRVDLRSRPGRGSCFWIDLPCASPQTAQLAAAPLGGLGALGLRVAVVDDDAAVRDATAGLLRRWGCEVWAADSLQALLAMPLAGCQRLVCDWQLGTGPDGLQAIAAVRAHLGAAVPALLVSGQHLPEEVLDEAVNAGLSVASKPLAPAALRAWLTAPEDGLGTAGAATQPAAGAGPALV